MRDLLHRLAVPRFTPPRLLSNPHLQTMLVPYLPARAPRHVEPVKIPIEAGALAGSLHRADAARDARGCVLLLHGIAGTSDEPFIVRSARLANARGLDALRLDLRGAGNSAACGPAPLYHAGLTDDVRAALTFLLQRYAAVHAVGFSLGGQLVLRTLGEWGGDAPRGVASVTAIAPPVDLGECATWSERRQAALYRVYILRALRLRYAAAREAMGPSFTADLVRSARTIRQYDAAVVAPFFGFRDVDEYYARASAASVIDRIAAPTLIVHAADDPLVSVEPVIRVRARGLPNVRVVVTEHGGHVGFYGGVPSHGDATPFWAEERAIDLAAAVSAAA